MRFVSRFILLFIPVVLASYRSVGQEIINFREAEHTIEVKNRVVYLEDSTNNLTINEISKIENFKTIKHDIPNFGISNSSFWFKLKIKNLTGLNNLLLEVAQAGLDEVELYQKKSDGTFAIAYSGEKYKFNQRQFFDPNYIFKTDIPTNHVAEIYIKVKARDNIQVPMVVGTEESIFESSKVKDTMVGIFLGIMLVMLFYNGFLYFTVRDKGYLYYVIYIIAVLLTQASIQGYTFQYLWPNIPFLAQYSSFIFPPLVGITSVLFLRSFLQTATFVPKYDKGFFIFIGGYLIATILAFIGYFSTSFVLIEIMAASVSFYMLWVAYIISKQGYRPARFFLLAWTIFLAGVGIYVMKDMGLLPYNNYTIYTMPIGSAIEVVLLSFALADRINILKREKEQSQAEVLAALKENEKLITEQNVILEQKVHERTEELEQKNSELDVALTNLKEAQSQMVAVEKMASLGQLTAGIAHEINNPINFVSANIRPLQMDISDILDVLKKYESITPEDNLSEKLVGIEAFKKEIDLEYVKTEINTLLGGIEDGAKRTAEIVKGLKNFSHLDESDIKEADINKGIESTLILLRSTTPPNIEIVKNLNEIPMIECYPGKLNQVFMNIINNAIQAMEKYPRDKHVLTLSTNFINNQVHVCIEDTGMGMTEEVKNKIYEPFFTTKAVGEGTGLGMSIVFGIIESHHAKILIDTEPGRGTKMTIILPLNLNLAVD